MALVLPTLLCLGLSAAQGAQAQGGETFKTPEVPSAGPGNLPQPQITAWPGSMIPVRRPVTIRCHAAADVEMFRISQEGWPEPTDGLKAQESGEVNLTEITSDRSGPYRCSYKSRGRWSRLSEPLKLVMTGAFDKPSLSCAPGTVVPSGDDDMELRCFSKTTFEIFILTKEGIPTTQNRTSSPKGSERQAIFLLNCSSSAHGGTYRCYGAFHNHPYMWSHPSDPFQFVIKEAPDRPNPTRPGWSTALPSNHTFQGRHQNLLIAIPGATMLLVVLLVFLFLLRLRKAKNNAARRDRQPEAAARLGGQASEVVGSQDITYSQLTRSAPSRGTAEMPASVPRETQPSEYATLALR